MASLRPSNTARLGLFESIVWAIAFASSVASASDQGEASFSVEIPAGEWRGVRLQHLPDRSLLTVRLDVDGFLGLAIVRVPASGVLKESYSSEEILFAGSTDERIEATVTVPRAGDFAVVVDNRAGSEARGARILVRGRIASRGEPEPSGLTLGLRRLQDSLVHIFSFDPVSIDVADCESRSPFRRGGDAVVCLGYLASLRARMDEKTAGQLIGFLLIRHVGLRHIPSPVGALDEERWGDELAASILLLLDQDGWLNGAIAGLGRVDSPNISKRVAGLSKRVEGGKLLEEWQTHLVPHMRDTTLQRLFEIRPLWLDAALFEKELRRRRVSEPVT